jgi:ABC-type nitrate/sulfonate/bicarbonate transport system permease component
MSNLTPYAIAWGLLAIVVIILAFWRRHVAAQEDDTLHVTGPDNVLAQQMTVARKLELIDRWGKTLTVILAITGLILGVLYAMYLWEATSRAGLA